MNLSSSRVYRSIVWVGGFALLGAMAIDVLAVLGRHTGIPLLGSIEVVQVLVAIAGAMALLIATLHNSHAKVRLVLARLGDTALARVLCLDHLLAALFFLALTVGSLWVMLELWGSHEESELWQLPYRPLRMLVVVTLAATTVIMLAKAWRGGRS